MAAVAPPGDAPEAPPASVSPPRSRPSRPEYFVEHMEEDDPDAPDVFPKWALLEMRFQCFSESDFWLLTSYLAIYFLSLDLPSRYKHMLALVGPGSTVHFTSLSRASIASLESQLSASTSTSGKVASFELHSDSVMTVAAARGVELSQICLLDPKAPRALTFRDFRRSSGSGLAATTAGDQSEPVDGPFDWFLFGGILGDDPPRDRTASLRQLGFPGRHLGGVQMTTDTALGVTKRVVEDDYRLNLPDSKKDEDEAMQAEGPSRTTHVFTWVDQPELKFGAGEAVEMPFRYLSEPAPGSTSEASGLRPLMPPGMRELIRKDLDRSFEF